MKYTLRSFPLILIANTAFAHEAQHLHHHITDPNWLPLAAGLLVIGLAAIIAWSCK
jgi:hypothetical protein